MATTALATGVIVGMMLFQPGEAQAQQVWTGPGTDWNTAANWAGPANVPDTAGETAVFPGAIAPAALAISASTTVGGITYDAGAQGYTITLDNTLALTGAGVVNNSGVTQNFVINAGQGVIFGGAADAGSNVVYTTAGNGGVSFQGTGAAAAASFVLGGAGNIFIQTASAVSLGEMSGGGGSRVLASSAGAALTIGALNTSTVFAGRIEEGAGVGLTVTKTGTGTLTLSDAGGASNYTGLTTISQGVLNIQAATALGTTAAGTVVANGAALELQGGIAVGAEALTLNGTGVAGGGALRNVSGGNVYSGPITLAGNASIVVASSILTLSGGVTLGANTLTLGAGQLVVNTIGIIGAGSVALPTGTAAVFDVASTYLGGTTIATGAIGATSVAGGFGTGTITLAGGTLRSSGAAVTVANAISLTANSAVTAPATQPLNLTGGITLGANTLVFNGAGQTTVSTTAITGAGGLTNSNTGTLILTGANTYGGATAINAGVVNIQNATALGTTAGGTTVAAGAALEMQGGIFVGAEALTLSGTGVAGGGALRNISGNNSYGGAITLLSATRINSDSGIVQTDGAITGAGQTLTVGASGGAGVIINAGLNTGNGALIKDGNGLLALNSVNTFTGSVTVNAGTLQVSFGAGPVNSAIGDASAVILNGGQIDVVQNETIGSLTGATGTSVNLGAGITLTTGGDNSSTTYSGAINGGGGGLVKQGTGTFTLSGANTYTGATAINGGELRVDGSLGATAVAVNNTGTLSGIGTLGGAVTVNAGGTLSAGQSPGTLTVGSLSLNAGSNSVFELNNPGTVGGVTNDLVISNGPVQLGGTLTATAASAGFYRLISVVGGGAITGNYATVNVAGFTGQVYTNAPGAAEQVNLAVLGAGQIMQFWDGADTLGNGTVDGGAGTWDATSTSWTGLPGQAGVNAPWQSSVAVFQGTPGVVTVGGTQAFDTLQFNTDGYVLNGGQLGIGVAGGGTINVNGLGLTATINSAIVDGIGTSLTKVGAGTLNLSGVNTYTGGTTVSDGTLGLLAGGVLASNVTVATVGTFNNAGTVNASVINSGTTNNSGLIAGSVTNTGTLTTTGTIQSGVTNSGTVNAAGTINGAIANNAGTFTVSGVLAGNGAFSNAGGAILAVNGGNFTGLASLVNAGSITIGAGRTLSAGTITNNAGTISLDVGAILQGTANTLNNAATINVATNGAILDAGAINNLAGGVINFNGPGGTATLSSGLQVNNAGAINLIGGNLNVVGPLSNTGQVAIAANLAANLASLSNAGSVSLGQGARLTTSGNLANTGMIELRNGATNNLVTVGGGWSGNGRVGLDLDIVNAAADRISVGGASSGLTTVDFAQLTVTSAVISRDVLVVNGAAGAQFVAANALTPTGPSPFPNGAGQLITNNGLVQYWFGEATPGSGTYVVRPDLNVTAATGFVASVSSALASINAFSEPASAFINGPADPQPNTLSFGTWGRARGGHFDITSNSTVGSLGGVSRSFRSVNEAGFNGFQLGVDAGLYNINGTGWTANLGIHGGKVDAKVTTPETRLEVEQPFYGVYGAVRSGSGFAFDVLVRRDNFDLKLNSPSAGLTNAKFKADGWSGLASMSQRFNITDSIYIDPSVAVLYSRAEVDPLRTLQANVSWQPIESVTGRFGVQLGTFIQPTETIVLAPYIAASVWREFAGKSKASGEFGGLSFPTTTDRVGTYGQFSAGVAVSSTTPGLSGFVRADLRFGEKIEGYAFNGGLRYQF
ncbi:autotransporter-associated beta strand repeat-containing protein [Bosea vaviloviae]|uniref:autotransporter-associated beta strand repeat-containing protein n=1 Tax=Bosea vaviloviae TaxID=1526658 RepID=UPI001314895A|nr:autotransporter-associated beta strand repeat-containing protein [Bosea vaviloviae]